jgi:hypothetical protein
VTPRRRGQIVSWVQVRSLGFGCRRLFAGAFLTTGASSWSLASSASGVGEAGTTLRVLEERVGAGGASVAVLAARWTVLEAWWGLLVDVWW